MSNNLNSSLLFGYYGGGNFGDELLLQTTLKLMSNNDDVSFFYTNRKLYDQNLTGYNASPVFGLKSLIKRLLFSKNVIFGGGGHWGMDTNTKILVLCFCMLILKIGLRKKIYLIGVGYYGSAKSLGNLAAFFISKSAELIVARDQESFNNFKKYSSKVYLDKDIAFYLRLTKTEINDLSDKFVTSYGVQRDGRLTLVSVRRFKNNRDKKFKAELESLISEDVSGSYLLTLLEPEEMFPDGMKFLISIATKYSNARYIGNVSNPLQIYAFLKNNGRRCSVIAPQYHMQLVSYLTSTKFNPVYYDHKVSELHKQLRIEGSYKIEDTNLGSLRV